LIGLLGADDEFGSEKAKEQGVAKLWIDRSKKEEEEEEEALDQSIDRLKKSWIEEEAGFKLRNRGEQATKEVSQTVVVTGSEFREN
jgi:hypothetical protein